MDTVRDFTKGNISRIILNFFFPMLITNMLQQVYSFADTAIVGKGLGDDCLAAVGNMGSLNFLVIGFSMGLAVGFSVLIAQYFGAKEYITLKKALASSITLSVLITATLTVLSNVYLYKALVLLQTDEVIIADSLLYGHIVFGGLIATIAYNWCAAVLRAFGDSSTPLKAIIISSVINIALDAFFIFILGTGVEGAAAATVFSQVVSTIICVLKLRKISYAHMTLSDFKPRFGMYMKLLKNGIPMAIMNSITAVGCMVVQFFVNGNGYIYTAAYSACVKYINLFMNPACTAGQAMSAYTSQNYGAKEFGRIKTGLKVCLMIAFISYITLGAFQFIFARPLAGIFLTSNQAINLAVQYLRITGIAIIGVDFLFVFRSGVQAMGYPLIPMLSGIAEMVMRIGVIVIFSGLIGFNACAFAEIGAWVGALSMNMLAFIIILNNKLKGGLG